MWEYLQTIILSFMIVLMLHFIYDYIKVNFTNEKHKNIIDSQTQKYKNIISEMASNTMSQSGSGSDMSEEDLLQYALDEANN